MTSIREVRRAARRCLRAIRREGPRMLLASLFALAAGTAFLVAVVLLPRAFPLVAGLRGAFFYCYLFTVTLAAAALVVTAGLAFAARRGALVPEAVLDGIVDRIDTGDREGAMEVCAVSETPLSRVVFHGLARSDEGRAVALEVVDAASREEELALGLRANWLGVIAAVAPMAGLVSFVVWLTEAFTRMGRPGAFFFDHYSSMGPALVPLAVGLASSIPAGLAHRLFRDHAVKIGNELRAVARLVVERVHHDRASPPRPPVAESRTPD